MSLNRLSWSVWMPLWWMNVTLCCTEVKGGPTSDAANNLSN